MTDDEAWISFIMIQSGAWQIKILRDFLESRDLSKCVPCQEMLLEQSRKSEDILDEHVQACIEYNGEFACIYFPSGGKETIDMSKLKNDNLQMWWLNPGNTQAYGEMPVPPEVKKVFPAW